MVVSGGDLLHCLRHFHIGPLHYLGVSGCTPNYYFISYRLTNWLRWKATAHPVMPQGIFASITNCAILAVVFLHGLVFISGFYYLPLYFQAVRDATPLLSGVYLLPTALSLAFASIGTGIVVGKTGMFLPPIYFAFIALTLGYVISHLGTIGQRPRLTFAATKGTVCSLTSMHKEAEPKLSSIRQSLLSVSVPSPRLLSSPSKRIPIRATSELQRLLWVSSGL